MTIKIRSAGIVVVRRFDAGWRYLLLRCFNYWDFPKGELEPGEDPLATACREVREETGLDKLEFHWGLGFTDTPPYGRGKVASYYLAECPTGDVRLPVSPELGAPEHHEFRWVSFEEGCGLVNERIRAVLHWAEAQLRPSAMTGGQ
jgi:bis(5'-nucleosidyl)-tetraphosphatase